MTIIVTALSKANNGRACLTRSMEANTSRLRTFMVLAVILYVVAITGFLIWRGISVSPDYFVIVLLLGAIALGKWKDFLVDWFPFVALFLGYEILRGRAGLAG